MHLPETIGYLRLLVKLHVCKNDLRRLPDSLAHLRELKSESALTPRTPTPPPRLPVSPSFARQPRWGSRLDHVPCYVARCSAARLFAVAWPRRLAFGVVLTACWLCDPPPPPPQKTQALRSMATPTYPR